MTRSDYLSHMRSFLGIGLVMLSTMTFGAGEIPDSLRKAYLQASHDSSRIEVLFDIAMFNYEHGGDLEEVYKTYEESLFLAQGLDDPYLTLRSLNGMGLIAREQGLYERALDNYLSALEIAQDLEEPKQTSPLMGIAIVHSIQRSFDKAIEYYERVRAIHERQDNQAGLASLYNNMGIMYQEQGNAEKTYEYYHKALEINRSIGYEKGCAINNENIGLIYVHQQPDPNRAIGYFAESLEYWRSVSDKHSTAITLQYMASALNLGERFEEGRDTALLSLEIAKEVGSLSTQKYAYKTLYEAYDALGTHQEALQAYQQFIALTDSIQSREELRSITEKQLTFEFEQQRKIDSLENAKVQEMSKMELEMAEEQLANERRFNILLVGGLVLFLGLLFVLLRNLKVIKRSRKILTKQKELIEERNKEITDSLTYARNIQGAMLRELSLNLESDQFFVLNKPKDIVSGDFYWISETKNYLYLAVGDCTGHGVPGAMMSMLGISILNEIVNESSEPFPNVILEKLRARIIHELNQGNQGAKLARDGMDMALIRFDRKARAVEFAGANNPLWIINNQGEFHELKPQKQPIGLFERAKPFDCLEYELKGNEKLYMFSDGYADQFGGPKGKKFKTANLRKLLLENRSMGFARQKELLEESWEQWKGDLEQVDDICVVGLSFQ